MEKEANRHEDQAEELKKLFDEVQQSGTEQQEQPVELLDEHEQIKNININVLNLPPRKEVHNISKKYTRLKLSKPFFRLLVVIIFILILIGGAYYLWGEELIEIIK